MHDHNEIATFNRLVLAAQQVCALAESGALFAACEGDEPQRTDAVAAFDALEAATTDACVLLGVLTSSPADTTGADRLVRGATVTPSQEA